MFIPGVQIKTLTVRHLLLYFFFLKVDRLFEWKRGPNSGIVDTIKKQKKNTKQEFDERVQIVVKEFAEQVCSLIMRGSIIKGRTVVVSASGNSYIASERSFLRRRLDKHLKSKKANTGVNAPIRKFTLSPFSQGPNVFIQRFPTLLCLTATCCGQAIANSTCSPTNRTPGTSTPNELNTLDFYKRFAVVVVVAPAVT